MVTSIINDARSFLYIADKSVGEFADGMKIRRFCTKMRLSNQAHINPQKA
jgi:hypothetical protein